MFRKAARFCLTLAALAALTWAAPPSAAACTSFAVYADRPWYGINFDYYPQLPLRFGLTEGPAGRVFIIGADVPEIGWIHVAGMNASGLFSASQVLLPVVTPVAVPGEDRVSNYAFHQMALLKFTAVSQARQYLTGRRVVQLPNSSIHTLMADAKGRAVVIETGKQANHLTPIQGRYMVMANFAQHSLAGRDFDQAVGMGADRFKAAHRYIGRNLAEFDLDRAWGALKAALNRSPIHPTRCSLVFDPRAGEVFICINGDFSRVWKASLARGTIQTHQGFSTPNEWPLTDSGLTEDEMTK